MLFLKRPYGLRDDGEDANFAPSGSRRSNSTRARLSYPLSLRPPLAYPPWEPQMRAPLGLPDAAYHIRYSVISLHPKAESEGQFAKPQASSGLLVTPVRLCEGEAPAEGRSLPASS